MSQPSFKSARYLAAKIDTYFKHIDDEHRPAANLEKDSAKKLLPKKSAGIHGPQPATIAGLAFFLGFNSRQAFDDYETNGKFSSVLKRGRLQIEAVYEKKLHNHQSAAGAIFALKSMGWNEKPEGKTIDTSAFKSIKIEIVETGPKPVENEKDVVL